LLESTYGNWLMLESLELLELLESLESMEGGTSF
jgi:hypothetical protein